MFEGWSGRKVARFIVRSPYVTIGIACGLVLFVGRLGMLREMEMIRESTVRAQVSEVKSNAYRTVIYLEQDLLRTRHQSLEEVVSNSDWIQTLWNRTKDLEPIRKFRAIVDKKNNIVTHSDSTKIGGKVTAVIHNESDDAAIEFSDRFDAALADDEAFIQVTLPIRRHRHLVGYYLSGVSSDWVAGKVAAHQNPVWWTWTLVISSAVTIVAITGTALYRLARRATWLERELHVTEGRRLSELSMLMAGMAHEIRNPLNSIRLNLHSSECFFLGQSKLDEGEMQNMLTESVREVDRVNSLIGQLLEFARPDSLAHESVDAAIEIEDAIRFFRNTLEQMQIDIQFRNDTKISLIPIKQTRLRQILLNLLTNARDALPNGGAIEVSLENTNGHACLTVADSGRGVEESMRQRIFEPFVTTREQGTGLGLAVVRSMLESIGGNIQYRTSARLGGAEFFLSIPLGQTTPLGQSTSPS